MAMRFGSLVLVLAVAGAFSCATYPSPSGPANASVGDDAAGAPSERAADDQVAPLNRPKSKWSVGGKSVSDVAVGELAAAFMQAGLTDEVQGRSEHANGYDAIRFNLDNGDVKGRFLLVRPAPRPTHKAPITTPAEAQAKKSDAAAAVLDSDADVYFEITLTEAGKAPDAQRMLDAVFKKGS